METRPTHTHETPRGATRQLLVLHRGNRLLGVYADAIEAADATDGATHGEARDFDFPMLEAMPAPLPSAPRTVRGVIAVRGRIYTLIDLARMFDDASEDSLDPSGDEGFARSIVVPLRGDEQLAIAADRIEATTFVSAASIAPVSLPGIEGIAHGIAAKDVYVIDTRTLFAAATRGMDRRRRRT